MIDPNTFSNKKKKVFLIGLTGTISSGKSTVAGFFKKHGCLVLDADKIVHDILEKDKKVFKKLIGHYGIDITCNGKSISRVKLASIVFNNKKELKYLNSIIHPLVSRGISRAISKTKKRIVVIDAPLLIEAGLHRMVDLVIVVRSSAYDCIERFIKTGKTENDYKRRMKFQMPLKEKLKRADLIINNNGTKSKLYHEALKVLEVFNKE